MPSSLYRWWHRSCHRQVGVREIFRRVLSQNSGEGNSVIMCQAVCGKAPDLYALRKCSMVTLCAPIFCSFHPCPRLLPKSKSPCLTASRKWFLDYFEQDVRKCEEWLAPDTAPFVQKSFGIERFDYALALLIDLGCKGLDDHWNSTINTEQYSRRGIIIKRITVGTQKHHQIQSIPETLQEIAP